MTGCRETTSSGCTPKAPVPPVNGLLIRAGSAVSATLGMRGEANAEYRLESSPDLRQWQTEKTFTSYGSSFKQGRECDQCHEIPSAAH
jgi:hypothetical protein